MVGCLTAAVCLWLAWPADAQPTAGQQEKSPAAHAPAERRAAPGPPVASAALERVDEIAGSIRYHGKKAVGIKARKNPATDEDVKVLANYLELTSLRVSHCQGVSDRGLAPLANMPKLRLLFLRGTPVTGACLGCVQEGAGLQRIALAETNVSDDNLPHLRGVKNLQWLSLRKTRVTDAGMRYLADLPTLTYLQLAETAVGDAGVAEIAKINSLEELDLELLQISEKGLAQLSNLKDLKRLNLAMVVVPDEAVTALQATIPGLDVFRWRIPGGWR